MSEINSNNYYVTPSELEAIQVHGTITNMINKMADLVRISDERAVSMVSRKRNHMEDISKIREEFIEFCKNEGLEDAAADFIDHVNESLHHKMERVLQEFEINVTIRATVEVDTTVTVLARNEEEAKGKITDDYRDIEDFDPQSSLTDDIHWGRITIDEVTLS